MGGGADALNGGTGSDTASYVGSMAGVTVQLDTGVATGGDAEGDVLSSIENLTGSGHADGLRGNSLSNRLDGSAGDDVLNGRGGADVLIGGSGVDTATYANSSAGVTARLDGGASVGGEAQGDTFNGIENLTGSAYADRLVGSSGANLLTGAAGDDVLEGRSGDDTLVGGGGVDRLVGGSGNDTLTGNSGSDLFDFRSSGGGEDVITDFAAGNTVSDVILLSSTVFTDFVDVLAHTTDDGLGNTVIAKGGVHITLAGVLKAQLHANDFDIAMSAPAQPDIQAKDLGPQVLPDEHGAKPSLFDGDDAIICPAVEADSAAKDLQPLVLPNDGPGLEPWVLSQADAPAPATQPAPADAGGFLSRWMQSAEVRDALAAALDTFDGRDPRGFRWVSRNSDDRIDDLLDELDPLVLPADMGPKAGPDGPIVCGGDAALPTGPFSFVTDTETLLAGREPHRLLMQPTANDWVW